MHFSRLPSSALRLTGADRVDFAQGQMTHDLRGAPTPGMVPALFLNVRGQIEFFARAYKRAQDVYLHLHEGAAPLLAERLQRYIIFDQVEVQDLSGTLASLHLWSAELPGWNPDGANVQQFDLAGAGVLAARVNRTGRVGLDLHVLKEHLDGVLARIGGEERPHAALERARVLAGVPDVDADRWQGALPQEVGLEGAISYRKGCYVGQEIMARLEARGNARFRLMALEGADLPSFADVTREGKAVGRAGHSVGGRVLVKLRKEVEAGAGVEVGGLPAVVRAARPAEQAARP